MKIIQDIFTVAEKELLLAFRFKLKPIIESFLSPLTKIMPILLIYYGFLHFTDAQSFGGITKENYIIFLNLGMFLYTIFYAGIYSFGSRFFAEKYWKTLDAILISPIKPIALIAGVGIAQLALELPTLALFFATAIIIFPISIAKAIAIILTVGMVYLICLSIGLMHGSLIITREGKSVITTYLFAGWSLFSCFTYPITIIPNNFLNFLNLQTIVELNPVYQGLKFVTTIWIEGRVLPESFIYVLIFAIIMPIIASWTFKQSWKKLGVEGY